MKVKSAKGLTARSLETIGAFWFFGAVMASIAGVTLLWPGTALDRLWVLNAAAHAQMAHLGRGIGFLFLVLSAVLVLAGVGWFGRRAWGWILAVIIVTTQVVGNVVNVLMGHFVRGGIGMIVAGALLLYLMRPNVKRVFWSRDQD